MFVLRDRYEFTAPVTVLVPTEGGEHIEQSFTGRFQVISTADAKALYAGCSIDEGDVKVLAKALIGWTDLVDAKNRPVPFSAKRRDWLIGIPFVRRAIASAFVKAVGDVKASV